MLQAGARVLLCSEYHWLPYDESLQTPALLRELGNWPLWQLAMLLTMPSSPLHTVSHVHYSPRCIIKTSYVFIIFVFCQEEQRKKLSGTMHSIKRAELIFRAACVHQSEPRCQAHTGTSVSRLNHLSASHSARRRKLKGGGAPESRFRCAFQFYDPQQLLADF